MSSDNKDIAANIVQSNLLESNETAEKEVEITFAAGDQTLYQSAATFEQLALKPELLKGVYAMGFQRPSKIQANALPLLLADPPSNMIAQSQSGTGKTAAFVLTVLTRIDTASMHTQALILAPARELARQIMDNIREMGKYTDATTAFAIPESVDRGENINAHVIVGTPGTVLNLIKKRQIDVSKIKIFVLDEADSMLDQQGLGDSSIRIKNLMPKVGCQIVLFSATFTEDVAINAHILSLKQQEVAVDTIKQFYMDCKDEQHKVEVLSSIYGMLTIGQSIIFVRRRATADDIAAQMISEGHAVTSLHGAFDAEQRDKAIDDFREGRSKVLITTNVIARGIDILQVSLVINFDVPVDQDGRPDVETYVHRIGRTGRFGRQGVSINFVHDEISYREMKTIEKELGKEIVRVPTADYMIIEKILKKFVK